MQPQKFLWTDLFSGKKAEDPTIRALKENKLFRTLNHQEIMHLLSVVHTRQYEPNEMVFAQYERGLGMYIIAKGAIEIKIRATKSEKQSPETLITTLEEGSFFGELALIDDNDRRTASAYAKGPTTLVGFFKPDLFDILERKPEMGVKILLELSRVLGKRLSETIEQIYKERSTK